MVSQIIRKSSPTVQSYEKYILNIGYKYLSRPPNEMGSGFSASKTSLWTEEEQKENETALKLQKKTAQSVATYFYYGLPIKVNKESADPLSPIWVLPDTSEIESRLKEEKSKNPSIQTDMSNSDMVALSLAASPTLVMVAHNGAVKIIFEPIVKSIEYHLHREERLQYQLESDDFFRPGSPFPPSAPKLVESQKTSLSITWTLPERPGISQLCEVQYLKFDERSNSVITDNPRWIMLVSKRWEYKDFMTFTMENLSPGTCYVFRVRYRNNVEWSVYSEPSEIFRTLPDVPCAPAQPLVCRLFPDSCQLIWSPSKDNGSPITRYVLFGKEAGYDVFTILYIGCSETFYVTELVPEFVYTFVVQAENAIGRSGVSQTASAKLPRRPPVRDEKIEIEIPHAAMADACKEAWCEYFDQKTGKPFYFNKITGYRTQEIPNVLKPSPEGAGKESEQEVVKRTESELRKKRYRLQRSLHANKASAGVLSIVVRRDNILWDAFDQLSTLPAGELRKRLKVTFKGESGIDSGGLGKEFFLLLSKEVLIYLGASCLDVSFQLPDGGIYFQPPENDGKIIFAYKGRSSSDCQRQSFLKFVGRFVGKALYDRQLIEFPHSKLLLRRMLTNSPVPYQSEYELFNNSLKNEELLENEICNHLPEIKEIDSSLYDSLLWILRNSVKDVIFENFSVVASSSSSTNKMSAKLKSGADNKSISKGSVVDLCLNGSKIEVTDLNKREYVLLTAQWRSTYSVIDILEPFLEGFSELVPPDALEDITEDQLNLMLNGRPSIDVEEIRAYSIYQGIK